MFQRSWHWLLLFWGKVNRGAPSLGIQSYSQMMIGVSSHLLSIVFRFYCHSEKVIGSLGHEKKTFDTFFTHVYLGSPSRPNELPIGRIGNPCSMDHPKNQPLCLVLDFEGLN